MRKKQKNKKRSPIKLIKEKKTCLPAPAGLPAGTVKIVDPEIILEKEIAEEDRDLRRAKVSGVLESFRRDREKRKTELRNLMGDLKMQRVKRREEMAAWRANRQIFMQGLRAQVLARKKMLPEVRI